MKSKRTNKITMIFFCFFILFISSANGQDPSETNKGFNNLMTALMDYAVGVEIFEFFSQRDQPGKKAIDEFVKMGSFMESLRKEPEKSKKIIDTFLLEMRSSHKELTSYEKNVTDTIYKVIDGSKGGNDLLSALKSESEKKP